MPNIFTIHAGLYWYVDVLTAECIIDEIMFGIKKKILIFSTAPWFGARLVMLLRTEGVELIGC